MNSRSLREEFIVNWLVWNNEYSKLEEVLSKRPHDVETMDPRGRTPLMLAVTLGHLESTRVLLRHDASVNVSNKDGWTVAQEAVATGDPEIVQEVIARRDYQRYTGRVGSIPGLLQKLMEAPDFYVEMKWEFTSWVPIVSRLCPSDTYRVYKSGSNVRIDTTLLGFGQTDWQRGNRSYVFRGQTGDSAIMMEIDHDTKQVYSEQMRVTAPQPNVAFMKPSEDVVSARLTAPVVSTFIDTDKISFERNKSGIWGWRSDKSEVVNGYECKVFSACNVELVTRTRTEHLTEADKAKCKSPRTPLQSFLGMAEIEGKPNSAATNGETAASFANPCNITPEEYFDASYDLHGRDIGRPKEITSKVQKFKANLCLCDKYPLSLQEQIMPIVDLMAVSSSHFSKLKDFITLQLPAGFPVKIEIPLFHVLNARITFGNIFGLDEPVAGVRTLKEDDRLTCVVDDFCFETPQGYVRLALSGSASRRQFSMDEDDELLQFAIEQSLVDAGSEDDQVTVWEALKNQQPTSANLLAFGSDEDRQLQRAIQASLAPASNPSKVPEAPCLLENENAPDLALASVALAECESENRFVASSSEEQLRLAISRSHQEWQEEELRRRQEEDMLQRILHLSMTEK